MLTRRDLCKALSLAATGIDVAVQLVVGLLPARHYPGEFFFEQLCDLLKRNPKRIWLSERGARELYQYGYSSGRFGEHASYASSYEQFALACSTGEFEFMGCPIGVLKIGPLARSGMKPNAEMAIIPLADTLVPDRVLVCLEY